MWRVVVLGGGSAGWLTASLLAAAHRGAIAVTVVEAPDIAPIGVGEGTWPTMRDTLREIGVDEADFVRDCDATFKQGSLFRRWCRDEPQDAYFHPFMLPQGYTDAPLAAAWLGGHGGPGPALPFAAAVSPQPHLCLQGRAPKQTTTPAWAAVANHGYHFDAGKLGPFLRAHAVQKLGVVHVPDEVVQVLAQDNGDIAALQTRHHGAVAGDLFIDCSGLRARLLAGHYGVGQVSCRPWLFCDAALALQLPYADPQAPIACQTIGTAQAQGWVWDIGLQQRRGVGLVYSTAHADEDTALATLQRYVTATGGVADAADTASPRRLRFDPGHRQQLWHRNCVAVGLAAGFVEPLEASALALVEWSAGFLRDHLPATRGAMAQVAQRFNEAGLVRWGRIIDFIKLHYLLSRREDSDFWRDNRQPASVPPRLAGLMDLWRSLPPSRHDVDRNDEPFPSASWQYVLYGMGFRPDHAPAATPAALADAAAHMDEAARLTRRMLPALPTHRALIEHIRQHGLHRI